MIPNSVDFPSFFCAFAVCGMELQRQAGHQLPAGDEVGKNRASLILQMQSVWGTHKAQVRAPIKCMLGKGISPHKLEMCCIVHTHHLIIVGCHYPCATTPCVKDFYGVCDAVVIVCDPHTAKQQACALVSTRHGWTAVLLLSRHACSKSTNKASVNKSSCLQMYMA